MPQLLPPMSPLARATFRYDCLRAVSSGLIDSAASTFLLLIATKSLQADSVSKSLIAAGGNVGLLLTLWLTNAAERRGASRGQRLGASIYALGSAGFLLAAAFGSTGALVTGSMLAMACANLVIPLITRTYQRNYPPRQRGQFVSLTLTIRVTTAMLAGQLGGILLQSDPTNFRWLLLAFGVALAISSWCVWRTPVNPDAPAPALTDSRSPFHAMRFVRSDRTLRYTLAAWMLMGFANLMMLPLRVEYLANPRFGIALDAQQIALFTSTIPSAVRILLTPVWGRLFDRMNFFVMRIVLNVGFAIGTSAFFVDDGMLGLWFGALVFGASAAGGELAWSLWVTKFSPPEHVMEYMTVHTFFTGVRGILAPLLAFQLIEMLSITTMGFLCAALIALASLILVPEMRRAKLQSPM
jgi:hypothetical protein